MFHIQFKASRQDLIKERLIHKRIEYAQLRQQMEMFATFLPDCFLDETTASTQFVGVVLNIQIVGIEKLIEKFNKYSDGGIYKLSCTLNALNGSIIESVTYWGGDVVKIYGDTMLNLWKVGADESLFQTLHLVVLCALILRDCLKNFDTGLPEKLQLKMGISCGNLVVYSYGTTMRTIIVRGDAMEFGSKIINEGKPGEIYISSRAWAHIKQTQYDVEMIDDSRLLIKGVKIIYKARDANRRAVFARREQEVRNLVRKHLNHRKRMQAVKQIDTKAIYTQLEKQLLKEIPPRVSVKLAPRICNLQVLRNHVYAQIQSHIDSNQPVEYLTEITTLAIQVIRIKPNAPECISNAFVQFTHNEISKAIESSHAFIYKFQIERDIQIVLVNGHGQRKDIEAQRSLKFGSQFKEQFNNTPGVHSCSIGIFEGYLYCGVMGHPHRRDYAVLGSIITKSENAVAFYENKIICDFHTFQFSKLPSFYFRCVGPKNCRHHWDKGQMFIYDEGSKAGQEETSSTRIFGRDTELEYIMNLIKSSAPMGRGIILSAAEKFGKSSMLEHIYKRLKESNVYCLAWMTLDEMATPPFFTIFKLYRQLYDILISRERDLMNIQNLPNDLKHLLEDFYDDEVEDMRKYYILKHFRDVCNIANGNQVVIVINNIGCIDKLSWEMLDIVLNTVRCRLIAAGEFTRKYEEMWSKFSNHDKIEVYELPPLDDKWINAIACQYLEVGAISEHLSTIICKLCNGKPGYINYCITFLTSSDSLDLNYMNKEDIGSNFVKVCRDVYDELTDPIPVMNLACKASLAISEDTIMSISKEFYHTLRPFEQRVLKTSSVLGRTFTRNLLIVALHYPDNRKLCAAIKSLFDKGIFICGSSAVNGNDFSQLCCRCYMADSEMPEMRNVQYPNCKLLHFRSRNFCEAVYAMVPENERKDIHILCTDILENSQNICPECIRNPMNSYFLMSRYKDVLEICNSKTLTFAHCENRPNVKAIKASIRMNILQLSERRVTRDFFNWKDIFDAKDCFCLDIHMFVYQQLMHHSSKAAHLGKMIFFTAGYGFTLMLYNDVVEAVSVLRKARELCFVDIGQPTCEVTSTFRKFLVGKISYSLSSCFIQLRQLTQSKNQIKIALRQYNIPLVSMFFRPFRDLLRKSYIVNYHNYQGRHRLRHEWVKWEIAMCTTVCAKIFSMEGDWKNARKCIKYSMWIMKHLNPNLMMVMDMFCNVVDIYHYGGETDLCTKLQKFIAKEVMCLYTDNNDSRPKHLIYWLAVNFELCITSGDLNGSLRLLYRLFDMMLKFNVFISKFECVNWIGMLFMYTLRIKDYIDMMGVLDTNIRKTTSSWYYTCAMASTLMTGYCLMPIESLMKNVIKTVSFRVEQKISWDKYLLLSIVYLHYTKLDHPHIAEKYKPHCPLTTSTLRKPTAMRILLNVIEASLTESYFQKVKQTRVKTNVDKQIELADSNIEKMKILLPRYHCLLAWKFQLNGLLKKSKWHLKKAETISQKQGNRFYMCFIKRLRSAWKVPLDKSDYMYKERINSSLTDTLEFSDLSWEENLIAFPT